MNRHLVLRAADLVRERPPGTDDDIHFPEALAESVILHTTDPGDLVLDPFAGYATTLAVATRLGRRAVGVELVGDHVEIARARLAGKGRLIRGDARDLTTLVDEPVDLALTSPPYMPSAAHAENPLSGYTTTDGDYETYLSELSAIFAQVSALLRPGGQLVVNVADVVGLDGMVTPLAGDLGSMIAQHLTLLGSTTLTWDERPAGIAADYLLWFGKGEPSR